MTRVLHVLTQRPGRTGSGVTLEALVRHTELAGDFDQHVVVGVPVDDARPEVGGLAPPRVHPLRFGPGGDLPFPVAGMSDVMPYESTVFGRMTPAEIAAYESAWRAHLERVRAVARPDVVHVNHIWLVGALARDVFPDAAIVGHCHATGLRQIELVPALAERVRRGNARSDRFVVLHTEHRDRLARTLDVPLSRIHVVGAGYRASVFPGPDAVARVPARIAYAGKLSESKGVRALLEAFEHLREERPDAELHMAGGGSGEEADALRARCAELGVHHHGFVSDADLARLLASSEVFVLPSYYEGLPLALVEAAASGCKLVSTALAGVELELAPALGAALTLVPRPEMRTVDEPTEEGARAHASALTKALREALAAPPPPQADLDGFHWRAVAGRVREAWAAALAARPSTLEH